MISDVLNKLLIGMSLFDSKFLGTNEWYWWYIKRLNKINSRRKRKKNRVDKFNRDDMS